MARDDTPQHGGKREGAGRPAALKKPTSVSLVLPGALLRRVDAAARRAKVSRSELLRRIVEAGLERSA